MLEVSIGTVLWSTIAFLAVAFILGKFAWKPILAAIKERESTIEESLKAAKEARNQMAALKADNEELLKQARLERDALLKEARDIKNRLMEEAKVKGNDEYNRIVQSARETINNEKMAAITELRNKVATLSLELAEMLLRDKFSSGAEQKKLIDKYIEDANTKLN